jgi:hypothetical protein
MAILTSKGEYPCSFELKLLEWERYDLKDVDREKTVPQGRPYTLWVKYGMALKLDNQVLYQTGTKTTLVLEDLKRLVEELRQLAGGSKDVMAFDPIEPDFGLVIRRLTESNVSVKISSGAEVHAGVPTHATNQSVAPSDQFEVDLWIDYPNQVAIFYGGYGPGLHFFVKAAEIKEFASQLEAELEALGPYFPEKR